MQSPSTAVAIIIMHEKKVLIGERTSDLKNCWQLPGGLIEFGETPNQAIIRETYEETNLKINNEQLIALTNNIFCTKSHTVSLIFKAKCNNPAKLMVKEKSKCQHWYWASWENLPSPLFLPFQTLVDSGFHPLFSTTEQKSQDKQNNCFIF